MNRKKDFPALTDRSEKRFVYLDSAATTHKPQTVIDAITQFYTHDYATVGRSMYQRAEKATEQLESVRKKVAHFINAQPDEIVFTHGATDSLNLLAQAWALHNIRAGDRIVVSELEHHSNLLPWQSVAQKTGAELVFIPVNIDGSLDYSHLEMIINEQTKLVAISTISNALGTKNDIVPIIKRAHAVGAKVVVDATQSVAHEQLDVQKLQPDFLVFSGHKMFGPTGIGILFINKNLHEAVAPYRLGGGMVFDADFSTASFLPAPHKFEAGTPPIAQIIGLGAAIDYLNEIDFKQLHDYEVALISQLIEGLESLPGVSILGPKDSLKKDGHLVSFTVENIHPHDVAAFLDQQNIAVRAGHYCAQPLAKKLGIDGSIRISLAAYNTPEDIDYFLTIMRGLTSR